MSMHRLHCVQRLPISIEQAWEFFSSPGNLAKITPPSMGFVIRSGAERPMYAGQIIRYTVKPLAGIPTTWITEISQVEAPHRFIDTQLVGPYRHWHHQHFFRPVKGGIEMEDLLHYQLPFGFLGDMVHQLFVKSKIESIFEYRRKKLGELFGVM